MNISGLRLPARQTGAAAGAKRGSFDLPFFVLTLLLLAIGVIMVLSSSFARAYAQGKSPTYYFVRQAGFAVAGVVGMILFSHVRMATYRRWSLALLGVSIFLLAIVWIPHIGVVGGGARRWLSLGFTTFQPSEIAKIAVVLFFSSMICTYKDQMQTIRYGVVPFMVITGGIVILLMLEPHLSASIIIMALAIVMMFVGGIKLSYLLIGMGGAGALLLIAGKFVPYVHKRIVSWRDPFADTSAAGYQIVQSLYSIGSGGFLGLGLGQSRQKYLYLPEEHNDYIFSIVCEELGYVGAVAILILFALLICRGYRIAAHSPDRYSFLVGVGITTLLSIQVFLNIAVVTNLIPCTGISLPFFSYGGTALLMQLGEVIFGGTGCGLYGMLAFAILTVFIAGLMVGRTPEFLGKKIEPYEMKWAVLVCLATPIAILVGSGIAAVVPSVADSLNNPGAHGFSELLYAYSSAGGNNGSAFAGFNANTVFLNLTLGFVMLFVRFLPVIGTLAIAGSLAGKKRIATTAGTLSTTNALFVFLLIFIVLLVGALSFFPALALGPIAEFFSSIA